MIIYKYDEATGQIVAENVDDKATINIPLVGSYEYSHDNKTIEKTSQDSQKPKWNFNNPLQNWNFPIFNGLKDLVTKDAKDPTKDSPVNVDVTNIPDSTLSQLANQGVSPLKEEIPEEPFDMSGGLQQILSALEGLGSYEGESVQEEPIIGKTGTIDPDISYEVEVDGEMTQFPWNEGPLAGELSPVQENVDDKGPTSQGLKDPKEMEDLIIRDVADLNKAASTATVDSTDYGLFQINDYWHDKTAQDTVWNKFVHPKDMSPIENIEYAKNLYEKEGWDVWAAYNNGSYEKFLNWTDEDYKENGVSAINLTRIDMFFTDPEENKIAKAIMFAESGGDIKAINENVNINRDSSEEVAPPFEF